MQPTKKLRRDDGQDVLIRGTFQIERFQQALRNLLEGNVPGKRLSHANQNEHNGRDQTGAERRIQHVVQLQFAVDQTFNDQGIQD